MVMKTNKKYYFVIIVISFICLFGYIIYCKSINKPEVQNLKEIELNKHIDSLETVIDSLQIKKTEIDKEIDTVYITIYKNNKKYEENRADILDNTVNEDFEFFSKYIDNYKSRYNNFYN